jgi:hypothetical protein
LHPYLGADLQCDQANGDAQTRADMGLSRRGVHNFANIRPDSFLSNAQM